MVLRLLLYTSETLRVLLFTGIPKELPESGSRYSARVRSGVYSSLATKWWQAEQGNTSDGKKGGSERGVGREGGDGTCSVINVSVIRCGLESAVNCFTGSNPNTTCRANRGAVDIKSCRFPRPISF